MDVLLTNVAYDIAIGVLQNLSFLCYLAETQTKPNYSARICEVDLQL